MGRILVVANETLHAPQLEEVLLAQAGAGHRLHVVVPLRIPVYADLGGLGAHGLVALEPADARTIETDGRERLEALLARLASLGVTATGRMHATDPVAAVARELRQAPADEILLSTKARALSRWLGVDLPRRLARRFPDLGVTTLENRARELVAAT